ncbi:MAG: trypsin-like peptidase domain-containing protein [Candidatus Pacebacteria bacterium]|nr:trypsin-like peptidase domain-containing protein [Candidatus Paceibacterota bacterium]
MQKGNYQKLIFSFLISLFVLSFFFNSNFIFSQAQDILKEISNFLKGNLSMPSSLTTSIPVTQKKTEFSLSLLPYLEKEITGVVKKASPAVVSIVVSKYVPIIERYYSNPFEEFELPPELEPFFKFEFQVPEYRTKGYEKQEVGGGTGFIVSPDGLILTNRHVVDDDKAEYTVYLNDGRKFKAKILLKHPVDDLALIKIDAYNLPTLPLGNSDNLQIGEFVIAIGNALGEFQNTVSFGVISGLKRNIVASDTFGKTQRLEDLIQTDAAINYGNSGGPLINIYGEVIGVNTAIVSGAQNIGFAIPINRAKRMIEEWKTKGKVEIPFLGIKYVLVDEKVKERFNLPYAYGAYVYTEIKSDKAVIPNSPAERAGIKEGDLILEIDGEKITLQNTLAAAVRKKKVGDVVTLKIWRDGKILEIKVTLGKLPENLLSQ